MVHIGVLFQVTGLALGTVALAIILLLYLQRPTPIYRSLLLAWSGITLFVIAHLFRVYGISSGLAVTKGFFAAVYLLNGFGALIFLWNFVRFIHRIADRPARRPILVLVGLTGICYIIVPVILFAFAESASAYTSSMLLPYKALDFVMFTVEIGYLGWGGWMVFRDDAPAIDPFTRAFVLSGLAMAPLLFIEFFLRIPHTNTNTLLLAVDPGPLVYVCINIVIVVFGIRAYVRRSGVSDSALPSFARQFSLSERELEVLKLILSGNSNKEIADALFISIPTVKTHVSSIFKKTGTKNRVALVNAVRAY